MFGSGIIIVISQLEALFGLDIDTNLYTTDIGAVIRNLGDAHGLTTLIGLFSVGLVSDCADSFPGFRRRWFAVVLGIVASTVWNLDEEGVALVGNVT